MKSNLFAFSLVAVFISAAYYSFISAVVVSLKLGSVSPPILFFLKIVLAIQGPLSFHMRKQSAMREVAREVLSLPCLREFEKRLQKEAG